MVTLRRKLNKEETEELLGFFKPEDHGEKLIIKMFATTSIAKAKYNPHDMFVLPANTINNSRSIETSVGRYYLNACMLYRVFGKLIPYLDDRINNKVFGKLANNVITTLHMEDKITGEQHIDFYNGLKVLESTNEFLVPSANIDIMSPSPVLNKFMKATIAKYQTRIDAGDLEAMAACDEEIIAEIARIYGENEACAIYETGGKPNVSDQLKQGIGAIGMVRINGKDHYITESFADGISIEGNILEGVKGVDGVVDRNKSTQDGGYQVKLSLTGAQTIAIDKNPKSDCKSKTYMDIKITKDNLSNWLYTYIKASKNKDNHALVCLDSDNIEQYFGQTVKMRVPLYCTNDQTCSICSSKRPHLQGIYDLGILSIVKSGSLLQKSLKSMHVITSELYKLDFKASFVD